MRAIHLTKGAVAYVSAADYVYVAAYKWHLRDSSGRLYAQTSIRDGNNTKKIYMHRFLKELHADCELHSAIFVDHKDNNGLNNTRENLRLATKSQNSVNTPKTNRPTSSIYKGIKRNGSGWMARTKLNGVPIYIGTFKTAQEAAHAYDAKMLELHGEYASLNFKKEPKP